MSFFLSTRAPVLHNITAVKPMPRRNKTQIACTTWDFSYLTSCWTQAQAPSYLNNTERGRVGFPRLSNWLCERQRC